MNEGYIRKIYMDVLVKEKSNVYKRYNGKKCFVSFEEFVGLYMAGDIDISKVSTFVEINDGGVIGEGVFVKDKKDKVGLVISVDKGVDRTVGFNLVEYWKMQGVGIEFKGDVAKVLYVRGKAKQEYSYPIEMLVVV